jgi:CRISPR system Cascade subunit CasA
LYWATPRRIRIDFDNVSVGECAICGRSSERIVRQYVTKNYGLNYKGAWDHPLSPYYEAKDGWLPLHPQPGGFGYRHWLPWVLGLSSEKRKQRPARVVEHFLEHRRRQAGGQLRLWAFGYDMDNMKARCWHESTLPLYGLADCEREAQRRVETAVGVWLGGAEMAASCLRGAVKDAWFGGDARGDFSVIDASFWSRTESDFYRQLKGLIETARDDRDFDALPVREAWHRLLIKTATDLFDNEFVGAGAIERQNPHRVAKAFQQLRRNLRGPKMRQALGLPPLDPLKSKSDSKAAQRAA